MRESPRDRRLRSDFKALDQLRAESSVFDFIAEGSSPQEYALHFHGRGVFRDQRSGIVQIRDHHEVHVRLGSNYPRSIPSLMWKTPIFHPNVAGSGHVCLGGYGNHWAPSVTLDELCRMLWDMIRFANYDIASPYNREAAQWASDPVGFTFPLDSRPLRDELAKANPNRPANADGRLNGSTSLEALSPLERIAAAALASGDRPATAATQPDMTFYNRSERIVTAEVVEEPSSDDDIMFLS